jgi:hypothetical protein
MRSSDSTPHCTERHSITRFHTRDISKVARPFLPPLRVAHHVALQLLLSVLPLYNQYVVKGLLAESA